MSQYSVPLLLVCCVLKTTTFAAIAGPATQQVPQRFEMLYVNSTLDGINWDDEVQIKYTIGSRVKGERRIDTTVLGTNYPTNECVHQIETIIVNTKL